MFIFSYALKIIIAVTKQKQKSTKSRCIFTDRNVKDVALQHVAQ